MRLRYLHLPRCGPLTDTAVVFGREEIVTKALNLPRIGVLNFVVGVNGSGKSSLLRAIYRIFCALKRRMWPELPVTLAWDRTIGSEIVTSVIHYTNQKEANSFFATFKQAPTTARRQDWEDIVAMLGKGESHPFIESLEIELDRYAVENSLLFSRLPKRLIVYTSGANDPWEQLDQPVFHPKDEEEGQYQIEDERPHGWSLEREWEEEQAVRMYNLLDRYAIEATSSLSSGLPTYLDGGYAWPKDLEPLETLRQKIRQHPGFKSKDDTYFRLDPRHLRFAGITLALWQTSKELAVCTTEGQQETLRNTLIQQRSSDDKPQNARRVLNEIDLFWPTHLSLTYRDADDRITSEQHQELLCLVALADEVITQPRGRQRAVISLGPSDRINLTEKLKDAFPLDTSRGVEAISERVDGSKTGAEAVLRIFSKDDEIDSTPMDVFNRLRDWERTGLLEDITLTIKRLNRTAAADGDPDDIIVTYDQLSDGEQMLLGRMGLLFLLRGQDGSLLLLDEPETHFNDVWKREIVDMVDMALLNTTETNVIVSTHTSIALTDAFAAEVTVFDKNRDTGVTTVRGVKGGLFGTDPGEVNMNLFRADSSTGSRSADLLDRLLKTEWHGKEDVLEEILKVLGSSFHRAELRAILKQLREGNDGAASS